MTEFDVMVDNFVFIGIMIFAAVVIWVSWRRQDRKSQTANKDDRETQ